METRHQEEITALRQEIKYQKKEHENLTRKMRELAEAQWNTVNRIPSSGTSLRTIATKLIILLLLKIFSCGCLQDNGKQLHRLFLAKSRIPPCLVRYYK